jgi:uncharacterized membrane protein
MRICRRHIPPHFVNDWVLQMSSAQRLQWLLRLLCVAGIAVASYLTWTHLAGTEPYCGSSRSCADVQNSRYAEIGGIPVAAIGLAGYVAILTLSLLRGRVNTEVDFYLPVLRFGAALIGVLYSAYLTYLEAFVILAWCFWCVSSAVIISAIWILSIADLRLAWAEG